MRGELLVSGGLEDTGPAKKGAQRGLGGGGRGGGGGCRGGGGQRVGHP